MKIERSYVNYATMKYAGIYRVSGCGGFRFRVVTHKVIQEYRRMKDAEQYLFGEGYTRKGFFDWDGAFRHTMTLPSLERLYKDLEFFIADCTRQEYVKNEAAIKAIQTLLHDRMNEEIPIK